MGSACSIGRVAATCLFLATAVPARGQGAGKNAAPVASLADGFSGDWVADLDTQAGLSADEYLVADGRYACRSCAPPRDYPADGRLRPVAGAPGTAEAVTVAGPRRIVTHIV